MPDPKREDEAKPTDTDAETATEEAQREAAEERKEEGGYQ